MAKLKWVDTNFDREFYLKKFANSCGQVLGDKALLNIELLAQELGVTEGEIRLRLENLGYVETGRRLDDLDVNNYTGSKYVLRPGLEEYPGRIDCSSFVCGVYAEFGVELPRYTVQQIEIGEKVEGELSEIKNFETGDLFFFDESIRYKWKSESGIEVSHVMLYLGGENVIDCSIKNKPRSVVVRNIEEVLGLGRKHVATRRYVRDFMSLVHFENRVGQQVEHFEGLRERLINYNNEEK